MQKNINGLSGKAGGALPTS